MAVFIGPPAADFSKGILSSQGQVMHEFFLVGRGVGISVVKGETMSVGGSVTVGPEGPLTDEL